LRKESDYVAFERVLKLAHERVGLPVFSDIIMPNQWHFVVRPETDTQVTEFFRWLTHTHTMRWHAHYHTEGTGHLYQGRFKTFPIEEEEYLLAVLRYVERNALRASLANVPNRGSTVAFGEPQKAIVKNPESWARLGQLDATDMESHGQSGAK
jgi:REP element-mobilizing transposase RayT